MKIIHTIDPIFTTKRKSLSPISLLITIRLSFTQRHTPQLRKIRRSQPRNRIPPGGRIPTSKRHNGTSIGRASKSIPTITTQAPAVDNIIQRATLTTNSIEERVQESHNGQTRPQSGVIQQGNDTTERRRGATGSIELAKHALVVDGVVDALRGDVGEGAAGGVEEA